MQRAPAHEGTGPSAVGQDASAVHALAEHVRAELVGLAGADAVFVSTSNDEITVYVVTREHGMVDWEALLAAEDRLSERFGDVMLSVYAHQGRDPASLFPGVEQVPLA